ncbi:MAG: MFS transporter [Candidatus Tectomicrobia bacterium]|uniref:MFS transporter n=1 Tax=Tectimicrobiota bacterium TaxID=2528274 RepID=A0A933LQF1_UNCTE|nr:MFS transporter [Candidatus Tectomicrobia bacterium]
MRDTVLVKLRWSYRIFPGWWTVVTGSFMNLWGAGYTVYGFSALFKPMSAELNFSRAVTSVAASIGRLQSGIQDPVLGWMVDRFGPRRVVLFSIFLLGIGLMSMYFIYSLWAFYLVWGIVVGIGQNVSSGLPINKSITNWFVKKRGLAMGMRMMLTAALVLPLITWFIDNWGWRVACVIGGIVAIAIGFPLAWLGLKDQRPEFYGLLPDGATSTDKSGDVNQMVERGVKYAANFDEVEFTFRQALRTPAYWFLIVAQIGQSISSQSLLVHFVPFLTDIGMTPAKAAAVVTMSGLFGIVSRFGSGFVADRVRKKNLRFIISGGFILQAAGIGIFLVSQTVGMIYPFLISYFFCMGVGMIVIPVTSGRYFGRKAFGSIQGSSTIITMLPGIVAPVYLGWVYDTTGRYIAGFATVAAILAVSGVVMLIARPPKPPAHITGVHQIV